MNKFTKFYGWFLIVYGLYLLLGLLMSFGLQVSTITSLIGIVGYLIVLLLIISGICLIKQKIVSKKIIWLPVILIVLSPFSIMLILGAATAPVYSLLSMVMVGVNIDRMWFLNIGIPIILFLAGLFILGSNAYVSMIKKDAWLPK